MKTMRKEQSFGGRGEGRRGHGGRSSKGSSSVQDDELQTACVTKMVSADDEDLGGRFLDSETSADSSISPTKVHTEVRLPSKDVDANPIFVELQPDAGTHAGSGGMMQKLLIICTGRRHDKAKYLNA